MGTSTVAVKSAGVTLLVVCLAASVGIALFAAWPEASGRFGTARMLGYATGVFIVITYAPLIWWAYHQFRWNRAAGPMTVWVALNVLYGAVALWG